MNVTSVDHVQPDAACPENATTRVAIVVVRNDD